MADVPCLSGNATKQLGLDDEYNLKPPSDSVSSSLEAFGTEFESNPLHFTVEAEVRDSIRRRISERLNSTVSIHGSLLKAPANYKIPYARRLCKQTNTDAVRTEVNIGNSSYFGESLTKIEGLGSFGGEKDDKTTSNKRLDIAILREGNCSHPVFNEHGRIFSGKVEDMDSVEVAVVDGSKYFPPEAISIAIEVKYVKDKSTASLDGSGMWEKVASDVEKLKVLREACVAAGTDPPETHLVVATNYDPFRLLPHELLGEENKSRDEVQNGKSYPERFKTLAESCAERGVHIWTYAPKKIYPKDAS